MLRNKKPATAPVALVCAVLLMGCAPSGTRLVLEARRLLAQGKYAESIQKLKLAVSLLPTNALVWNELGLAYHYAGNTTNAAEAYRKALSLDRDLAEAHYNLGCLLFEQGKFDSARSELSAYTMRRPKDVAGWLRLGSVQLRLHDAVGAEKSFTEALKLGSNNPAALNGLGVALLQRNRPKEAAQAFAAAVEADSGFAPALLNLAIVSHTYLNNRQLAIEKYRQYAALDPRPADAQAVLGIAQRLEQEIAASARASAPEVVIQPPVQPSPPKPQQVATGTVAAVPQPKPEPAAQSLKPMQTTGAAVAAAAPVAGLQPPAGVGQTAPATTAYSASVTQAEPLGSQPSTASMQNRPVPPRAVEPEKVGLLDRLNPVNWFRRGSKLGPTPLPSRGGQLTSPAQASSTAMAPGSTVVPAQPGPPAMETATRPPAGNTFAEPGSAGAAVIQIPRYAYRRVSKPATGDAQRARLAVTRGIEAHRAKRLTEAMAAYREAIEADPSCFEAYYNLGVAAYEAKAYQTALMAYETALALEPDSAAARYNFALALRDSGYLLDAAAELEKVVAANPIDTRAHLALGNLYAQRLGNRAQARVHYLRVLELDPGHPQATAIRYWLAANPG